MGPVLLSPWRAIPGILLPQGPRFALRMLQARMLYRGVRRQMLRLQQRHPLAGRMLFTATQRPA
ncbi:MAG: hypothetical protein RMI91_04155 [Gemmatales bacterium]|nr:hypothetical protein [Gemmatales bacterium]MDW7993827.1 hypothetical protein [Gemmatales bacterium]